MGRHAQSSRQANLVQRALALSAQGNDKNALELIQQHLGKQPRDSKAINIAASFAARLQNWALAEQYFTEALDVDGSDADALYGLSKVFKLTKRLGEATAVLTRLLEIKPHHFAALNEMGAILAELGQIDAALQAFERACKLEPTFEMAYRNWCELLYAGARYEEMIRVAKCALDHVAAGYRLHFRIILVLALWQTRALGEARELAENIIGELEPSSNPERRERLSQMLINYGVILSDLEEPDAARLQFEKSIVLTPRNIAPYINLARLAIYEENLQAAIGWFEKALAIDPENSELHHHLAVFLREAGRPDLALPHCYAALEKSPDNAEMRFGLGITQFSLGKLQEAYKSWDLRWARKDGGVKSDLPIAEWRGAPDTGRSLLVYREQGIGDEILFASCLPDVTDRFERIICVCHTKLKHLFERSFPKIEFRNGADALTREDIAGMDWQIAIGSLLPIVRPNLESFPPTRQFLLPDPAKVSNFRGQLGRRQASLVVGVAWRSGLLTLNRRALYPYLEFWQELFEIPNVTWVNLQYGDVTEELKKAEQQFGISIVNFEGVDHFNDIDTSAALMKACDLMIGTDGSSSVIAAAVGTPTIRMYSGCDYFNFGADHDPFLSSMATINRKFGESWVVPIHQAASIVRTLVSNSRQHTPAKTLF